MRKVSVAFSEEERRFIFIVCRSHKFFSEIFLFHIIHRNTNESAKYMKQKRSDHNSPVLSRFAQFTDEISTHDKSTTTRMTNNVALFT